ncbi:hypothetical protein BpHYR1_003427 [Brachionus plicatilis]|uniref:Uncharacterized protein n=1 Tax=Brachionus plicatilis TaxID=10195 RepID=A0A3M7QE27_BRAPC|nr:hypothetical protein BpHYR1_003427 [Brachionus plicatilis]
MFAWYLVNYRARNPKENIMVEKNCQNRHLISKYLADTKKIFNLLISLVLVLELNFLKGFIKLASKCN